MTAFIRIAVLHTVKVGAASLLRALLRVASRNRRSEVRHLVGLGWQAASLPRQPGRLSSDWRALPKIHLGIFRCCIGETNSDANEAHGFSSAGERFR